MQDWEKALARKLQDNWRKDFSTNPMRGSIMYQDLTVLDRVSRALIFHVQVLLFVY